MPGAATHAGRRPGVPPTVASPLALLIASLLALAACGGASDPTGPDDPAGRTGTGADAAPPREGARAGTTPFARPSGRDRDRVVARVRVLLAERARAVLEQDEAAFLETVDDRDPALVEQQRVLFANLAALRLTSFSYGLTADRLVPDRVRGASPGDRVVRLQTVEHARLTDVMTGPAGNVVRMTYVRDGDDWLLGRETPAPYEPGDEDRLRPWFGGPVEVADRGELVVLADAGDAGLADRLADLVEEAVAADAALLDVEPDRQVLVDATGNGPTVRLNSIDRQEAAAIYTDVFDVDVQGRRAERVGGTVRVNPALTAEQLTSDPGLLRHEIVHLLLREYQGVLPMWLSEGIAEYARWHPLTTDDLRVTPDLWRRLQLAPRELPAAGVFQLDPPVSYLVAQAAAQHLIDRGGTTALRTLLERYRRDYAGSYGAPLTRRLLVEVYGTTEDELVAGTWAALTRLDR